MNEIIDNKADSILHIRSCLFFIDLYQKLSVFIDFIFSHNAENHMPACEQTRTEE